MSLSEHEQQVLDEIESDLTNVAAYGHLPAEVATPGSSARSRRARRRARPWRMLIGVGLDVPASAAGEAIAVARYLVIVGALSAVLDARRRRGLRPAWSRLWRLLASRSTTPQRGDDSGPAEPA